MRGKGRIWTLEEDRSLVRLKNEGTKIKRIAEILGRTESAVSARLSCCPRDATGKVSIPMRWSGQS